MEATATMKRESKAARGRRETAEAKAYLLGILPPGATVHTILRRVSASGMSRDISTVVVAPDGTLRDVTWYVAKAMRSRCVESTLGCNAIRVSGAGMDVGFHLVHNLGFCLFGLGEECAAIGYHSGRNGMEGPEDCGAYLLNQRWL